MEESEMGKGGEMEDYKEMSEEKRRRRKRRRYLDKKK